MFNLKEGDLNYLISIYESKKDIPKFYSYERPRGELIFKNTKYKRRGEFYSNNSVYTIPMDKYGLDIDTYIKEGNLNRNQFILLNKSMFDKYSMVVIEVNIVDNRLFIPYIFSDFLKFNQLIKFVEKRLNSKVNPSDIKLYINGYSFKLKDLMKNLENEYNKYLEEIAAAKELAELNQLNN